MYVNRKPLTPAQVQDIRQYLAAHTWRGAQLAIARKHGVSAATVNRIFNRHCYADGYDGRGRRPLAG